MNAAKTLECRHAHRHYCTTQTSEFLSRSSAQLRNLGLARISRRGGFQPTRRKASSVLVASLPVSRCSIPVLCDGQSYTSNDHCCFEGAGQTLHRRLRASMENNQTNADRNRIRGWL